MRQPPHPHRFACCALALALSASACGGGDDEAPDLGLSNDAAAASAALDAGRAVDGSSASPEASASAGDAGTAAGDAGRRSDAGRADAGANDDDDDDDDDDDAGSARDAGRRDAGSDAGARDAGTRDGGSGGDASTRDGGAKTTTVNETIIVPSGQTFDGQGQRFIAGAAVGDGSQMEGQQPIFRLESGATLRNVVLGAPAADGVHTYGDATLENIVWEDIGEDALTIKAPGTVVLNGGSATDGSDKIFQINAESTFRVSNFKASHAGKFIRQNGGTTFKVQVYIDRCDISHMDEAIFRTDSSSSTVSLTNTRHSEIGDALFVGVAAGNITESGNTAY
jgi:pectate lyase C